MEEDKTLKRLNEIIEAGNRFSRIGSDEYWVSEHEMTECYSWISSAHNIIKHIVSNTSPYVKEIEKILEHDDMKNGISYRTAKMVAGLLLSLRNELNEGFAKEMEYVVVAETFDDFLDHAAKYHKGNKKQESSVMASAVLEDTLKKIAKKNNLSVSGKTLEQVIDSLVESNVITSVKAKRVKGFSAVRNKALHAEWDEFDISDVGGLIKGIRGLLDDYL
jgi:uncharacterized protein YutE (UPF0331/DUF86 family)